MPLRVFPSPCFSCSKFRKFRSIKYLISWCVYLKAANKCSIQTKTDLLKFLWNKKLFVLNCIKSMKMKFSSLSLQFICGALIGPILVVSIIRKMVMSLSGSTQKTIKFQERIYSASKWLRRLTLDSTYAGLSITWVRCQSRKFTFSKTRVRRVFSLQVSVLFSALPLTFQNVQCRLTWSPNLSRQRR